MQSSNKERKRMEPKSWLGLDITNINTMCGGIGKFLRMDPLDAIKAIATEIGYPGPILPTDNVRQTIEAMEVFAKEATMTKLEMSVSRLGTLVETTCGDDSFLTRKGATMTTNHA